MAGFTRSSGRALFSKMDERELAWAAGFFDGDGWAALVRAGGGRIRPMARINQSDPDGVPAVLLRFRAIVSVGVVRGPTQEPGLEDAYHWDVGSRVDVRHVGSLLAPWLCEEKRAQFAAAIPGFELPPRREDLLLPWCGGFFDAEGSTSLSDHRSHAGYKVIEAGATQSGINGAPPDELLRFQSVISVGRVYGPYDQEGALQPVYRWRAYTANDARLALHRLMPWIGPVKRKQATEAFAVIDAQPALSRGRIEWGSHKTHCVHGHEYAAARVRAYHSRGKGIQRRDSKQCLVCTREQAREARSQKEDRRPGGRRS
jgi:hypothetical protein